MRDGLHARGMGVVQLIKKDKKYLFTYTGNRKTDHNLDSREVLKDISWHTPAKGGFLLPEEYLL